jgi:hypothetical protein
LTLRDLVDEDPGKRTPLLAATSSAALVLCTTPDGKTYAGDTPPPAWKVKSEYTSAEPPSPREELDAELTAKTAAQMNAFDARPCRSGGVSSATPTMRRKSSKKRDVSSPRCRW